MIKILQVIHDLNFGGMQQVVADLATGLPSKDFDVQVLCIENLGVHQHRLYESGIRVHLIQKNSGLDISLIYRLTNFLRLFKPAIVHTHGINPFFYGSLASFFAAVPVVIQTDHARGLFPVSKKEMLSERLLSYITTKIAAVSNGVKHDLIKYEKIPSRKIEVIYNGIQSSSPPSDQYIQDQKALLNISENDFVIGIGVRLSSQKAIDVLLHAFSLLYRDSFKNLLLLIAGDGEERIRLEKLAYKLSISDRTRFLGYRSDIDKLLYLFDLYILPSLWEGHPLVLLEAMAASLPIIATDIPGNNETITHGFSGLIVKPKDPTALADSCKEIILNPNLANALSKNARRTFLCKFSKEIMIQNYISLYKSLLTR